MSHSRLTKCHMPLLIAREQVRRKPRNVPAERAISAALYHLEMAIVLTRPTMIDTASGQEQATAPTPDE